MSTFTEAIKITTLAVETKTGIFGLHQEEMRQIVTNYTEQVNISDLLEARVKELTRNGKINHNQPLITEEMSQVTVDFVDDLAYTDVQKAIITFKLLDSVYKTGVVSAERIVNKSNPLDSLFNLARELQRKSTWSEPSLN